MVDERFARTALLIGESAVEKLNNSHIAVFGVGGVGGYVVEALVRSGIGHIDIIDNDTVNASNINRQIIATENSIGRYKTEVMAERIHLINPACEVTEHRCFFLPENKDKFDFSQYDYVIDAIDTVTAKIAIIMACKETDTPVISSMGTGNKLDPTQLQVSDIYKTSVCPLAKVMRHELKKRDIKNLKVVYSTEIPRKPQKEIPAQGPGRRDTPGSTSFVPPVAGMIIASEVVKDLCHEIL